MALISRELGQVAEGMRQGVFDAQRYNANEQAQALQREQLGEITRQKDIRTQIGALDRSDPTKFAQGAYNVHAGAGNYGEAMAASGHAAGLEKQRKLTASSGFASAVMSGDVARAQPFIKQLGLFGGKDAQLAGFDEKDGSAIFHVPDAQGRVTKQRVKTDNLIYGALQDADPEKADELWLKLREQKDVMKYRMSALATQKGANNRWDIVQIRDASGKGRGKATAVLKSTDGIYVLDEKTTQPRRATPQEIAVMGGGDEASGPMYGPRRAALEQAFASKKFTEAESPAQAGQLRFEAERTADMEDAVDMLQGADERTKLEFLAATGGRGMDPAFLQRLGLYDPKTDRGDRLGVLQNAVSSMIQRQSAIQR